ncbi:MAG: MraY family glycosyltransferase [Saprospiraceae bacterium]|nr:undecaprenyl/decaprenyl-phosphate alpha-N-acetylglucosaminyl 1-phosphate transferase [Saprospiraceae bacterium]MCB9342978.1 undecaprenyl/decaprenyl-phosphate alpha-N-acetylglucosaminyl 1-phosphate transferase [Lewinellaceae bacterium]
MLDLIKGDYGISAMFSLLLSFITAFLLTYLIIPIIIRFVTDRMLLDKPNDRSSHFEPTPSLGGIGIFIGTLSGIVLWTPDYDFSRLQYILAAIILIFLIGVLDDLKPISPAKKFVGQVLVAVILVYKGNTQISSFYGVFGIEELPALTSFVLSVVVIVGIINAFNLIDGINGLAGSIALLACTAMGMWFYATGLMALATVALSLAGSIIAFLKFNFTPARIFMGDTGSLLLGTICALLAINFIEANHTVSPESPFIVGGAPAIAIAILILPIYDTLRSLLRRILKGQSPFRPDKHHIHHQMLRLGLNHTQTTGILMIINLAFVLIIVPLHSLGTKVLLLILFILSILLTLVMSWLDRRREFQKNN